MWKKYKDTNYEVSPNGEIRSLDKLTYQKTNNCWFVKKGVKLKPGINSCGYLSVIITHNNKRITKPIHTLVAETYLGLRPENLVINHKDGNKLNNDITNLEYVTHKQNIQHAWKMGLGKPSMGEKNGFSKLSNTAITDVFRLREFGLRQNVIADILNVSQQTISAVLTGKVWKSAIS
jgi:hypothetical protein